MKIRALFLSLILILCTQPVQAGNIDTIRQRVKPKLEKELTQKNMTLGAPVYIRVFKQEKIAELWLRDQKSGHYDIFKRYPVCVFSGKLGPKLREGDLQAPEGFYDVTSERLHPESKFHLAFNLGYPNEFDRARGRTGKHLMIHGECQSRGCFAMSNEGMEEIYLLAEAALNNGQDKIDIHIFPFFMTKKNMKFHNHSTWMPFWKTLKPAYDNFQKNRVPPKISVRKKQYKVSH